MESRKSSGQKRSPLALAVSIILASVIVAASIFLTRISPPEKVDTLPENVTQVEKVTEENELKPVDEEDHIVGSPNAKIVIVEFSDIECPYCKDFHQTMQKIIDKYGKSGDVAWVYRHFPIESLHPKAIDEAIATECVAKIAGNEAFWEYTNELFEKTPSNNKIDLAVLDEIAMEMGVDQDLFTECRKDPAIFELVQEDITDGINAGVNATPYSIAITMDNQKFPIVGGQPFDSLDAFVKLLLDN